MGDATAQVRGFIEFALGTLLDHPDSVQLDEVDEDKNTVFELTVHEADYEYLRADEGRVGEALMTMVDACAYKHRIRAALSIGTDAAPDASEEATA